jgi:hypothetical protein
MTLVMAALADASLVLRAAPRGGRLEETLTFRDHDPDHQDSAWLIRN